ncbi:MAG: hypothetical protein JJT89_07530 [Nitriliruptoraceae bacterium]|nr:hypothetical protein [Nitriliruptoraceae bacterium]
MSRTRWLLSSLAVLALLVGCATDAPDDAEPTVEEADEPEEADDEPGTTDDDEEPAPADEDDTASDAGGGATDDASATEADGATEDDGADGAVLVSIGDFFFDADAVSIEVGDTVTWSHDGRITHNVTARDDSFVSDNLGTGETFSHTFTEAGTFEYVCTLHGQMVATVEVG